MNNQQLLMLMAAVLYRDNGYPPNFSQTDSSAKRAVEIAAKIMIAADELCKETK